MPYPITRQVLNAFFSKHLNTPQNTSTIKNKRICRRAGAIKINIHINIRDTACIIASQV